MTKHSGARCRNSYATSASSRSEKYFLLYAPVSASRVEDVMAYIENQAEHHRTMTFQEEYRSFLKRSGVTYDERFVWD